MSHTLDLIAYLFCWHTRPIRRFRRWFGRNWWKLAVLFAWSVFMFHLGRLYAVPEKWPLPSIERHSELRKMLFTDQLSWDEYYRLTTGN